MEKLIIKKVLPYGKGSKIAVIPKNSNISVGDYIIIKKLNVRETESFILADGLSATPLQNEKG